MKYLLPIVMQLLIVSLQAQAEIAVRGPDVDEVTYLKSIGNASTVVDHLRSQLPHLSAEKRLLNKFEKAQSLFLTNDMNAAKVAYIEVTEEALRADWRETQRLAILISFLRVAQISVDPHVVEDYLKRASQFSSDAKPETTLKTKVDPSLFPPPLMAQFDKIQADEKAKSLLIDLKEKFPQHDLIIINGKNISPDELRAYRVFPGRHRITALSNSHQILTQELTASQLSLIKADVPPYIIGTCQEPALSGYQVLNSERVRVIFSKNCVRTYTGTNWSTDTSELPVATNLSPLPRNSLSHAAPQPILNKKKLLFISLGVGAIITTALIIKHSKQRREEIQPINRQGF